jgi:hypothetical protein
LLVKNHESVGGRRLEQPARLGIAQSRRAAFIAIGHGALDAVDRIAGDGVVLAEIIEQGGERRELAADAGVGELAFLEVLAPGDDVGAGDGAQPGDAAEAGEGDELLDVDLVSPAGFGVGEVGEPFELGGMSARSPNWAGVSGRRNTGTPAFLTGTRSCFMLLPCPSV